MTERRKREGNEKEGIQTKRGQLRQKRASAQEELMLISGWLVSWTEAGPLVCRFHHCAQKLMKTSSNKLLKGWQHRNKTQVVPLFFAHLHAMSSLPRAVVAASLQYKVRVIRARNWSEISEASLCRPSE